MKAPFVILLVDDDPADIRLTAEAFKDSAIDYQLVTVSDGVKALKFLRREGEYHDAPKPDLMLLDLNLPRKDGRQVLEEVKIDPHLRRLPIVVLTTSHAEHDLIRAYDLHANCYVTKPLDFDQFRVVVSQIRDFWLSAVKLPPR